MEKDKVVGNQFDIVIIGGSAGSLQVLMKILPQLKAASPYALVIVLHRKNTEDKTLEELIDLKSIMCVKEVEDKVAILPGYIYVAPSDYHLLFEKETIISLDASEKINYSRPSIDVSFESAAESYGPRVLGIVLSGANADGTKGLQAIKQAGGLTIVQNPTTAEMPFMPKSALVNSNPDCVFTIEEIIAFLNNL